MAGSNGLQAMLRVMYKLGNEVKVTASMSNVTQRSDPQKAHLLTRVTRSHMHEVKWLTHTVYKLWQYAPEKVYIGK